MNTPIVNFVNSYIGASPGRFHMPGHKGADFLGCEKYDITEIPGADVLYSPSGIIEKSEKNATGLFGTAHTFYSAEGSSLCIKAMLAIVLKSKKNDTPPLVLAARNVHKAFVYAVGLLGMDVEWLYSQNRDNLCSCPVTAEDVARKLSNMGQQPDAVYITSPDYLGNIADVEGIARVCDSYGVPLLVDNAHGAYLNFLKENLHPMTLGAAMCSDSAHKTLPVLTGGAYLHISKRFSHYTDLAREALSVFASTSPSYLILQSLDLCNRYIATDYRARLDSLVSKIAIMKEKLDAHGYSVCRGEKCKIVLRTTDFGYTGTHFAQLLQQKSVLCEYADEEYAVFMLTPQNSDADLSRLYSAITSIEPKACRRARRHICLLSELKRAMSVREAMLASSEMLPIEESVGRVCASVAVSCPPAVPIAVLGEVIDSGAVEAMKSYGVERIAVVK